VPWLFEDSAAPRQTSDERVIPWGPLHVYDDGNGLWITQDLYEETPSDQGKIRKYYPQE
jgi:hypothetical protein